MITRLLGSTALLSAVLFTTGSAHATAPQMSTPKLTISGQSSFNAWWFKNDQKTNLVGKQALNPLTGVPTFTADSAKNVGYGKGYLFTQDDSRLKFDVSGKTDPGMEYGVTIVANADTNQVNTIKENFVWFGGSWGKLTLGDAEGVERTMAFGGFDPLGATGGFDGNFDRVVNFTTGTLHSVNLVGDSSRSTKATYQTPRWKGFQAGISYAPRTDHKGEAKINSLNNSKSPKEVWGSHVISAGLNFINKFNNGLEMALSATALFDQANAPTRNEAAVTPNVFNSKTGAFVGSLPTQKGSFHDARAYALGALFDFKGWELGAEFGYNGKSHQLKNGGAKDSWFVDTGISYTWGCTKLSTGYFYGQQKPLKMSSAGTTSRTKAKTHTYTAAIDHKIAPGVGVFFEYAHYNMKNKGANVDAAILSSFGKGSDTSSTTLGVNSGKSNAFVLGTKIKF